MALVERLIQRLDLRLRDDLRQLAVLHPADDLLHDAAAFGGFDHQRQLHRRSAQFHGRPGVGILRAVDDQRPVHQVVQIGRAEAEAVAGHAADERGAGFVARVVQLPAAGIAAEMLLIFRR